MVHYETLLLAKTEVTEEELAGVEKFFEKSISDAQGTMHVFDRWGKLKLAFSIKSQTYGIYALVRYTLPKAKESTAMLGEVDRFLQIKCHDFILRHLTKNLKTNAAAPYIKPESSTAARSESLDSFLKDSKIENLLTSVDSAHKMGHSMLDDEDNNND